MTPFLLSSFVWNVLGLLVIFGAISSIVLTPVASPSWQPRQLLDSSITLLSMALLGGVVGYLTGQSREPAIGAVLPAVLSLIGGLVLYILTNRASAANHRIAACSTLVLVLNILVGAVWGATAREAHDLPAREAVNRETIRQAICLKRLAFEIELSEQRKAGHQPDANPMLLVPGCTPPFGEGTVDVGAPVAGEAAGHHAAEQKSESSSEASRKSGQTSRAEHH